MTLQAGERQALTTYRRDKALSTLEEAHLVADAGRWNLTVQRLYYAVFYAACALLISNGDTAATHSGVKAMISLKYVKPGILSNEDGYLLGKLFSMRQTGDYTDNFDWLKEDVEPLIKPTEDLVNKILGKIDKP